MTVGYSKPVDYGIAIGYTDRQKDVCIFFDIKKEACVSVIHLGINLIRIEIKVSVKIDLLLHTVNENIKSV